MTTYDRNDKRQMYQRYKAGLCNRIKMYPSATEDSIEDWYYFDGPVFVGTEEWKKIQIIKTNYAQQIINAEVDPQKKEMMELLFEQGVYDFEGL